MKTHCRFIPVVVALTMTTSVYADNWFVDDDAPGGLGDSWPAAFNDLSTALGAASDGDQVFVAEGSYSPGSSPSSTFAIPAGIKVYGGFQNGDSFGDQDPQANPTVLDGGGNVSHVVTLNADSRIDGFTVTGGDAGQFNELGGGITVQGNGCGAVIANCIITANTALAGGGVAVNTGSSCSPVLISNCVFSGNHATFLGGAVYTAEYGPSPTHQVE